MVTACMQFWEPSIDPTSRMLIYPTMLIDPTNKVLIDPTTE